MKKALALKLANNTESITGIDCPRGVLNPGLYFGFIKGWEACADLQKQIDELRRTILNNQAMFDHPVDIVIYDAKRTE